MFQDPLMNDTFDNFTFSGLDGITQGNKCLKKSSCSDNNVETQKVKEKLAPSNEISFDDSVFLNDSSFGLEHLDISESNNALLSNFGEIHKNEGKPDTLDKLSISRSDLTFVSQNTSSNEHKVAASFNNLEISQMNVAVSDSDGDYENKEKLAALERSSITKSNKFSNEECIEKSVLNNNTPNTEIIADNHQHESQYILNPPLDLASWGIPESILSKYARKNVTNMFPWQAECLSNKNVLINNSNLVYSAPTSAGKTLVAEILAMKTLLERNKKVIFILPFVSVVREKMFYFQDLLEDSKMRVEGFMGSYNPPGGFDSIQVAICTIEKANSLVNKLLTERHLSVVGAVIVDEIHLIGDASRGYLLELLLTKLKYMCLKDKDVNIQIIGMSATLPNLSLIAKWLNAELFITTYRPVPLYEQVHVCGEIYDNKLKLTRRLSPLPDLDVDTDNILQLCLETIAESASVLIFCPTKNWCENLAQQISQAFWKLGISNKASGQLLRQQLKSELIQETLQQLKLCPVGLDDVLKKTVSFAVGFHHAGLTMDERDIIEGSFRNGALRVLVATSTLSSGVNLPARRVIIRTPLFHGKTIDTLAYRQMIGRAGRMGKDKVGESILICQKNDKMIAKQLLSADLEEVQTCLEESGKIKRAILEIIASGVAASPEDVELFTNCTLLSYSERQNDQVHPVKGALDFLQDNEFIRLQTSEDGTSSYLATALGKACLSSSLPPHEGLALFAELEKARRCFVLDTELHLVYLVTPYSACNQWGNIDWMFYLELWNKLPSSMKRVAELVGVEESFIIKATRGQINASSSKLYHKLLIHKRFYVALALQDLVNERSLNETASKFSCNRGMLQSLQQSASTFAGMVTSFSKQLRWSTVEILISQFQDRLHYGVSRDLLDLMRLPILNSIRARALYNAGIETLSDLANSDVATIENILFKLMPFESSKEREGETAFENIQRNKLRTVWITGKQGLSEREAADMLISDARKFLEIELGLVEAKWDNKDIKKNGPLSNTLSSMNSSEDTSTTDIGTVSNDNAPLLGDRNEDVITESSQIEVLNHTDEFLPSPLTDELNEANTNTKYLNLVDTVDAEMSNNSLFEDSSFSSNTGNLDNKFTDLPSSKNNKESYTNSEDFFSDVMNNEIKTPSKKRRYSENNTDDRMCETPSKKNRLDNIDTEQINQDVLTDEADYRKFDIIDVCKHPILFDAFCQELKSQNNISLSVGCLKNEKQTWAIGERVIGCKLEDVKKETKPFSDDGRIIDGIAVCWGENTVYYICLQLPNYANIILTVLQEVLTNKNLNIKLFDSKEQVKIIHRLCKIHVNVSTEDPKIIDWLLQSDGKEKSLQYLASEYCPEAVPLSELAGCYKSYGSIALDENSAISPRMRSCVEAIVTWYVMPHMKNVLLEQNFHLLDVFGVEMDCLLCLAKMEHRGFSVSRTVMDETVNTLQNHMKNIEKNVFSLAGRRFSIASSKDVANVLGISNGKKVSTRKDVLKKVNHPISELVQEWRKIHFTLYKMIIPIMQAVTGDRIHMNCVNHNSTGRISMLEPNLQNVTKDFETKDPINGQTLYVSCRNMFVASKDSVLVSADYCQLELRILAHFSQDEVLCKIMRSEGDIFKSIAARWNQMQETEVTDLMRQHAKQICYGIIYGMGNKALSEQLSVPEEEAAEFVDTFHKSYPGLRKYIKNVIDNCRENGYVETLVGRRRYLPHIKDGNVTLKSQAERQAVNTTIQGSAADITKKAMVLIEKHLNLRIKQHNTKSGLVLHLHDELIYDVPLKCFKESSKIIKDCMEKSVKLSIPFPVKLKSGPSWGQLTDFKL